MSSRIRSPLILGSISQFSHLIWAALVDVEHIVAATLGGNRRQYGEGRLSELFLISGP